jgi:toxin ParE1/3/4
VRIEWHPVALTDLADAVAYIANENASAAHRITDEILRQTDILDVHPEVGRIGRVRGTRELVITKTPYIVAYRLQSDCVTVLRLLHGARLWPRKL